MAQKPLSPEDIRAAQEAVQRYGSVSAAARALGMSRTTLQHRAQMSGQSAPIEPPKVTFKPTYRIAQIRPDGRGKTRMVSIGDAHDGPGIPKDRFRWIGSYVRDTKPDLVNQIGDLFSLDSLCRYDANDTAAGKLKPTFKQDMASGRAALAAFDEGAGPYNVEKHVELGNHEDRIWSFMNRTPEMVSMLDETIYTILGDFGWSYSPYGAFHFVGGVGFVHVPLNRLGKPYGGKTAENQIGNDALHDIVFGHTHHERKHKAVKVGSHNWVTILNLGCALPDGHIEKYVGHGTAGWSYGIYDLTIENGKISNTQWVPMAWLEETYG